MTIANRVQETTVSTGTGTINLAGAPSGRRTFVSAIGSGQTVRYIIESADGTSWEIGRGVVTAGIPDTMTRVTVIASSNANALVNFAAGSKNVSVANDVDLARFGGGYALQTAGGTADARTIAFVPAKVVLLDGEQFWFINGGAANATTTPTLQIDANAARTIVTREGGALAANDMPASALTGVAYHAATDKLRLLTPTLPSLAGVAYLAVAQGWTKGQGCTEYGLADGATITPDLASQNEGSVVLGGNRTLGVPTNLVAGRRQRFVYDLWQDSTGSRTLSYAWPYSWPAATAGVLTTTALARDKLFGDVAYYGTATVTISIATPGVVTWNGHGLKTGSKLQLSTTGALPTGLAAATTYFVIVNDANSFWLATTKANAAAGTKIATSGGQSGVHTAVALEIDLTLAKAFG